MPQTPFGFYNNGTIAEQQNVVKSYTPATSDNVDSVCTLADASGKVIKKSKAFISSDGELTVGALRVGDSYSMPRTIGQVGQILVVPTLGSELKFLDVDPSPIEVDDLQTKTQNILLPLTTPEQTTFVGNIAAGGLTVGLPDAADAWHLLPGHGQPGDQLLFPGGDSSDAYWGKASSIAVLEGKAQNISYGLTSPSRTEFIGRVNAEDGVGFGADPNRWRIPALAGGVTGQQMLWDNATQETTWGEAPKLTTVYGKTFNIYNHVNGVSTTFDGVVKADDGFGLNSGANAWTIPATRGTVTGQSLLWDGANSRTTWAEPTKLTSVYDKTLNMGPAVAGVSSAFGGLVAAGRFLVGESPNDWKIGPGQGLYGDSLNWPETGSTAVWGVSAPVQTLQEQCQFMTSGPLGTDFSLRVSANHLVSNSTITVDAENPSGSYILPLSRGAPDQVLVAGGGDGSQCIFKNNVLTKAQAESLLEKTQFQMTDITGTTFQGQLVSTTNVSAPVMSAGVSIQVNSDSLTGSYLLPASRGLPGQVLVAAGEEGETCEFQNAAVSPAELSELQGKTRNILTTTSNGVTNLTGLVICHDLYATGPAGTTGVLSAGTVSVNSGILRVDSDLISDSPTAIEIATQGPSGVGYSLPRRRGTAGQGLLLNSSGGVVFGAVADPTTLSTVVSKTQYQNISPAFVDPNLPGPIPTLTSFQRGIQLRPSDPLSTDPFYNLPEARTGDAKTGSGFSLRTNGSSPDLVWTKPAFYSRWRRNIPGDYTFPFLATNFEYLIVDTMVSERKSAGFLYDSSGSARVRYNGTVPRGSGLMTYNSIAYIQDAKGQPATADITFRLIHYKSDNTSTVVDVRRSNLTTAKMGISLSGVIYDIDNFDYFRVSLESSAILNLHIDSAQLNVSVF